MNTLAINGGTPIRTEPFKSQVCIERGEIEAVEKVLRSGVLSGYRANKSQHLGGIEIRKLCLEWAGYFGVEHVIPVNSCTSGLFVALSVFSQKIMAAVTPLSMTCSASLPRKIGMVTSFCDVEPDFFQLDPDWVKRDIHDIAIPVSMFGHPLAKKYDCDIVIEDSAQCVSKQLHKTTLRVHSFTEGKHITSGEGGIITTDDPLLAEELRLVMNHAESVIHDRGGYQKTIGFNLRMTEMQAALVRSQLKRLDENVRIRRDNVQYLNARLGKIPGIRPAKVDPAGAHSYYCAPFHFERSDISRKRFLAAVRAELSNVRLKDGYIEPLNRFQCFNNTTRGLRFDNADRLHDRELFLLLDIANPHNLNDMRDVANAFEKVAENVEHIPGSD